MGKSDEALEKQRKLYMVSTLWWIKLMIYPINQIKNKPNLLESSSMRIKIIFE